MTTKKALHNSVYMSDRIHIVILLIFFGNFSFSQNYKIIQPDSSVWSENQNDTLIVESLVSKSREINKPILLYFFGSRNINSYKVNEKVLSNNRIAECINLNFLAITLDLNSRTPIPKSRTSIINGSRKIKYLGDINKELQQQLIQISACPAFVIMNQNGIVINFLTLTGRERDMVQQFKKFLFIGYLGATQE